jgi:hypothetical protein
MGLQINTVQELKELLGSTDISITDPEELRNLLDTINSSGSFDPERHKEDLARQERQHEREHAERLRALELGIDPAAAKAHENAVVASAWAAGFIGTLVPLAMVIAAAITTSELAGGVILQMHHDTLGIIWGCCTVISVAAIAFGIVSLRRAMLGTSPAAKQPTPNEFRREVASTAFKDSASSF